MFFFIREIRGLCQFVMSQTCFFAAFLLSKPWFIISGWGGLSLVLKIQIPNYSPQAPGEQCFSFVWAFLNKRPQTDINTGWWFNKHVLFSPRTLGFHDPIWLYSIFQRGGLKPPTRTVFFDGCLFFWFILKNWMTFNTKRDTAGSKKNLRISQKVGTTGRAKGWSLKKF